MKFLAKNRMYFLRVSILLLIVLSVTNNDFRAYTLEITTMESLQMSILGFVLVVFGSFGRIWASLYIEGNKTKNLITAGPFSMVRNPLYFFSLIMQQDYFDFNEISDAKQLTILCSCNDATRTFD